MRRQPSLSLVNALEVRLLLSAPVNSVPGLQSTAANIPLAFAAVHGNPISISAGETAESPGKVTLTASHGVVSLLSPFPGDQVDYISGDGNADAEMTFVGTVGEINRALQWVIFRPESGYVGDQASLSITTDNQSESDAGEPTTDTDVIPITLTPLPGTELIFNVGAFGAVGDGLRDDAPAIRATIAAAIAAGGGTILFPPATYRLASFDSVPGANIHFNLTNCEGLRFSGVGAILTSTSTVQSTLFALDGARRMEFDGFSIEGNFARQANVVTQQGIGVFRLASTSRDSESIRIANLQVTNAYYLVMASGDLSTPYRVRDVSLEECDFVNGFYGLNFQNNGDDFSARGFRTQGLVRSYFPYGVDHHDVEYTSVGGDTFTDCLIKAYQRDTTNINVRARIVGNTSPDAKLTLESQHDPSLQPFPARLRNIRIQFDDVESIGSKSVRVAYFQDTPTPVEVSTSLTTLFDGIVINGTARNPTEFAVVETQPGIIDLTRLNVLPSPQLSATVVPENQPVGATVGILSMTGSTTGAFVYSLVPGLGADDNGSFNIVGNQLQTATAVNFEVRSRYTIRVRSMGDDGSSSDRVFTILVADVNEERVSAISDLDTASESIFERAANGTRVGVTAFASDGDGTNNKVTYSLVNDAGGRFAINTLTGVVTVANSTLLDFESATTHSLTVRATSADGSISDATFVVQLHDVNEFRTSPIVNTAPGPVIVREGAAIGTMVGITAYAFDSDGSNNRITYSLWSNAGGRFAINPTSGVVTVAKSSLVDREAAASWSITVLATSDDGSASAREFAIVLEDVDEYDVGQVFDMDSASNSVFENAPVGTAVGVTGFAVDQDATTNGVTYSLPNSAGGRFAIDAATGVVRVASGAPLDREAAASWTITVRATSEDGSTSTKDFAIQLLDVDEFDVGEVTDRNAAANSVAENAANGTVVGLTAFGADLDATNSGITYSLWSTLGGRFAIDPKTGVVKVANGSKLDRESAASWLLTVVATSQDGSVGVKEFTIQILDVDEFNIGALSDADPAPNLVAENAAAGTPVGIIGFASDPDATARVAYSLEESATGRFAIDPTTGSVTVAGAGLDREAAESWSITVRATSTDGSLIRKKFNIALADVDEMDVGEISDANKVADRVLENSPAGTQVGITARAVDGDATNNVVTYTVTDDAGGRFQIHQTTGVVSVADGANLDFETAESHQITVLARSSDGSSSSRTLTIAVGNVFDAPQLVLSNSAVAENQPAGTVIGTFSAHDLAVLTATYSLVSGEGATDNGKFTVVGNELRLRSSLNFETKSSYSIRVQLRDENGILFTQVFTISATDVPESPTGLTLSSATIVENNEVGQTVGLLQGVDPDAGDTLTYTLVSGSGSADNGRFIIEGNELKATEVFRYERKRSEFSIRVRVTDSNGLSYEKVLKVRVARAGRR